MRTQRHRHERIDVRVETDCDQHAVGTERIGEECKPAAVVQVENADTEQLGTLRVRVLVGAAQQTVVDAVCSVHEYTSAPRRKNGVARRSEFTNL